MTVVLDVDVLIGALDADDAHHGEARRRFEEWSERGTPIVVGAVTLAEVLVAPASDADRLRRARQAIAALRATTHAPTEAIAVDAARLRQLHPISLADAFLLATARKLRAGIATFDQRLLRAAAAEDVRVA